LLSVIAAAVPLDGGGDLVDRFVGFPVFGRSSWSITTLLVLGFVYFGLDVEAMLVVIVEELVESGFCVGFTGEDAVVQLVDRVFEIGFGIVEIIIDSLAGSIGQR